jgi:hypothetical protein
LNVNVNLSGMLDNSGMDCTNYSATLVGWNANPTCPTGRTLGASGRTYGPTATGARANFVGPKGWTITGDGQSVTAASSTPTLCINTALTNITHTTREATGIGAVTGLPAGVTATWFANTITISGIPTESGTFNYSIALIGGCLDVNAIGTIIVQPSPQTPTTVTISQPTCIVPTGSVSVTATNGIYYSIDGINYSNVSGVFSGLAPGTYNITSRNDDNGCTSLALTVVILPQVINTWNGTTWSNGAPIFTDTLIFNGNYNQNVDFQGCSCTINSGNIIIPSGTTVTITNGVNVAGGSLTFENSSSLVQINDASINTGTIIYKRNSSPLKQYDFTYWSSPVASTPLSQLATSSVFYSFSPTINNWVNESGTTIMAPGVGYIARAPNNLTYSPTQVVETVFSGIPNNGVISTSIIKSTGTYNLIGNPYPSAIDIDLFLTDPSNTGIVNGTIYLWTHNTAITNNVYSSNDYAKYNFTGGVRTATSAITGGFLPTGKVASGQGFFIEANSSLANGTYTATYRNAMRVAANNTQFFRTNDATNSDSSISSSLERHRIWLSLSSALGSYNEMLLGYVENATNDFDALFDGKTLAVGNPVSLFTTVGTDDLSIQGRALPFNSSDIIPVGYSTTVNGQLTVNLENYDGLFSNQEVYLLDNYLGIYHDIKSGVYNFTTTNGTFRDRFELRFTNTTLNTNTPSFDSSVILVTNDKKLSIFSGTYTITKVEIFDLLGKKLYYDDKLNTNNHHVELPIATQAIIVKITSDDTVTTVKKAFIH